MTKEDIEKLKEIRKSNFNKLAEYRKRLKEDLYNKCLEFGGHEFYAWQHRITHMLFGSSECDYRICRYCKFEETKNYNREI